MIIIGKKSRIIEENVMYVGYLTGPSKKNLSKTT